MRYKAIAAGLGATTLLAMGRQGNTTLRIHEFVLTVSR
jgi:hypothetical protein